MDSAIQKLYDEVMRFMKDAKDAAINYDPLKDMHEMQHQVQALCEAINKLPLEKRVQYRDQLEELFGSLKSLEEELIAKRDSIREELSGVQTHRAASKAYVKADHRDKPTNDN